MALVQLFQALDFEQSHGLISPELVKMEGDSPPECLNTSQCREIYIRAQVPLEFALYLYGYVMPFIVAVTVATNSFIVVVLSHRHLRTPTNIVLLAMAVTELLTGLSCLPWLLYYYTFDGT